MWDQWNEHQGPSAPNEHVLTFVRRNFTLPVAPGTWAFDLGCGSGADARFLMECGFNVTGVDTSAVALANTQALVADMEPTLHVQQSSLSHCELPAKTYACAISVGALDAAGVDEARIAVPRLVDALKPGGKAILVFAADGDSRIAESPELELHGFTRREVESLIVLEYGLSAWIDSCTTTFQSGVTRQIDWIVTIAKR
ncbi:MAG: class I SAM-dependent methyltransferase [Actinomycetota bacterium]|nr:class I SAM-dependent methyltransferase [Actinomycetota bacterium]